MRLRALLLTVVVAAAGAGVPGASASYPNVCYQGVDGVTRRALVAADPAALGRVSAVVARAGGRVGAPLRPLGVRAVELPTTAARDAVVASLRALPGVAWAEPDHVVRAHRSANDPMAR